MRAVKTKYALALNISITNNEVSYIKDAIEQAKQVSDELDIQIYLHNPYNGKSSLMHNESDVEKVLEHLK